jgi:hypothetical protein
MAARSRAATSVYSTRKSTSNSQASTPSRPYQISHHARDSLRRLQAYRRALDGYAHHGQPNAPPHPQPNQFGLGLTDLRSGDLLWRRP